MSAPFHAGEIELQRRAASLEEARALGRTIRASVPAGVSRFLERQRLAVASSVDAQGRVWASLLTGGPGFITRASEEILLVSARPPLGDPLASDLAAHPELGLLVLDPHTRQRMRFNGRGLVAPEGVFLLVDQVYGNCPKYIQRRALDPVPRTEPPGPTHAAGFLGGRQREWIGHTDTFFIASLHPQGGADASHRGGFPGFVRVLGPRRLAFDDYPGNGMFNTLGNLSVHPSCGLLFVDFENGHLLQITGQARVGAGFSVEMDVDLVRETPHGCPQRWTFVDYSPANPSQGSAARHHKKRTGEAGEGRVK